MIVTKIENGFLVDHQKYYDGKFAFTTLRETLEHIADNLADRGIGERHLVSVELLTWSEYDRRSTISAQVHMDEQQDMTKYRAASGTLLNDKAD